MRYQIIAPPKPLENIVRSFWILEGTASQQVPMPYRLFADACPNLVFNYHNQFSRLEKGKAVGAFPVAMLHGQTNGYQDMEVTGRFGMVGVYLYPSSLPLLFGLPAIEVTNHIVDVQTLLGKEGEELEYKILMSNSDWKRIALITNFFMAKLREHSNNEASVQFCVDQILQTRGSVRVEHMAETVNLSRRQLERKFVVSSGLSPKLFSRITRFRHVIRLSNLQTIKSLSALAYEAGYSDQSHFIREFKEFSGYTPKTYFKTLSNSADTFVETRN